jgi:hypothetical protein
MGANAMTEAPIMQPANPCANCLAKKAIAQRVHGDPAGLTIRNLCGEIRAVCLKLPQGGKIIKIFFGHSARLFRQ